MKALNGRDRITIVKTSVYEENRCREVRHYVPVDWNLADMRQMCSVIVAVKPVLRSLRVIEKSFWPALTCL